MVYRGRWLAVSCLLLGAAASSAGASCGNAAASLVVTRCSDVDAGGCYSNGDCSDPSLHCGRPAATDPSTLVTCCIPGARGAGDAGTPCQSADDCASAVCAYTMSTPLCSQACQTGADCPPVLPSCVAVPGSAGDGGTALFCGP